MSPPPQVLPIPRPGARARTLALLTALLVGLGLSAWIRAPSPGDPATPPGCPRWLQLGRPGDRVHCVPKGREWRLALAGLPTACYSWITREPIDDGDRIVWTGSSRPRCQRKRMAPPLLATLGIQVAVNRADASELTLLPGVGPALARRIVRERHQGGPFRRTEDLRRVRGIGPRLATRIGARVRF